MSASADGIATDLAIEDDLNDHVDLVQTGDGARHFPSAQAMQRDRAARDCHGHGWSRAIVIVLALAVLVVEGVLLAPHVAKTGDALRHIDGVWLAIGIVGEIASMFAFARLQRRMLRAGGVRVPLRRVVAVAFAANAMSVTLPAGPVLSYGYTFRRMRRWGASAPLATWGMVASGALSTAALAVIGLFGTSLAGNHGTNLLVILLEILLVVVAAVSLRRLSRRPVLLMSIGDRLLHLMNRVLRRPGTQGEERVHELVQELALIRPRAQDWLLGLAFAMINWCADLLCLIAACRSIGADGPTLQVALIAYAAGMAASSLPLLPGGIGVVDGALVLALTHGGMSAATATAGVVVYRLISFALVALLGWIAWLILNRYDRRMLRTAQGSGEPSMKSASTSANRAG